MSDMDRIRRLAAWLAGLALTAMVALPVLAGLALLRAALAPRGIEALIVDSLPDVAVPVAPGALWLALALPGLMATLFTLGAARRLLGAYARGEVLTAGSARLVGLIGRGLAALALLGVVAPLLQSVVLTWSAPPGRRALVLGIGGAEVGFLLAGGLMTLIGWAMAEAARQAEEMRGFV